MTRLQILLVSLVFIGGLFALGGFVSWKIDSLFSRNVFVLNSPSPVPTVDPSPSAEPSASPTLKKVASPSARTR